MGTHNYEQGWQCLLQWINKAMQHVASRPSIMVTIQYKLITIKDN